ncbi:hypothetical protein HF290_01625 [Acidithiobacillus ferrooxidans]|nr:hypothetical protein [Acidithiobacillus ferrooxidans]
MHTRGRPGQHGKPHGVVSADQLVFREEMSRPDGVADGPVVLGKPGNAGWREGALVQDECRKWQRKGD